jgi:acetyl esterase/lipase
MSDRRLRRVLLIVGASVLGLVVVGAVAFAVFVSSTEPDDPDDFYAVPSPLPEGTAGTIVRSEEVDEPPAGARAWRILYRSQSYTGEPTAVSGLIFVPDTPAPDGGRPVVASTHGTIGIAPGCAGSRLGPSYDPAVDGLNEFLRAGYVVVAPDYQGLGTPGPHPYLVGEAEAVAALDAVRAAGRFEEAEAGSRFAVFGASQGGQAALFTGEQASSYAPELTLVGVAAAAPATDLATLFEANRNTTFGRVLSAYTIDAWTRVYPELRIEQLLTLPARPIVRRIARTCIGIDRNATIAVALTGELLRITYLRASPWDTEPWKSLIARNSPGAGRTGVPMLITQGEADRLIRPAITRSFVERLCAQGETVAYRAFPGVDHLHAGPETAAFVAAWVADRFTGEPAPSTCAS